MTETLEIDNLTFIVKRSNNRSSIGITVERDGDVTLHAPTNYPVNQLEDYANQKLLWIHQKLAKKNQLRESQRNREFVTGEGFYYLGRSYRLLIVDSDPSTPPLRLYQGRFCLRHDEIKNASDHYIQWYINHADVRLYERTKRYSEQLNLSILTTQVQDLGSRWASCSPSGLISYHWRTILLPLDIIDYIIVHELAHILEPHHTDTFWSFIEKNLPDYKHRKQWLAEHGAAFDI